MPAKAAESKTLALRLPVDLYDDLTAAAEHHGVTLNRQAVNAIQMGLISEAQVDEQVAALMPVLAPRVAQAIRDQSAAERARRTAKRA